MISIEILRPDHYDAVREIFLQGIASGNATFETEAPTWEKWYANHLPKCRLVAVEGGLVIGWAALSSVSSRRVYSGVAEESVYIHENARGKGTGTKLLNRLVEESEQHGIWMLQAGIFPENTSSLIIHRKAGFREVGFRERIGKMNGTWRNTILLERRSNVAGID